MKWNWHFSNSGISGVLRIGASTNVGISLSPRFMQLFQETYPQVHTQVHIQTTAQTEAMLLNGALDLAIVGGTIHSEQIALTSPVSGTLHRHLRAGTPDGRKTVSINTFMKQPLLFREVGSTSYEYFKMPSARPAVRSPLPGKAPRKRPFSKPSAWGLASRFFQAL